MNVNLGLTVEAGGRSGLKEHASEKGERKIEEEKRKYILNISLLRSAGVYLTHK